MRSLIQIRAIKVSVEFDRDLKNTYYVILIGSDLVTP